MTQFLLLIFAWIFISCSSQPKDYSLDTNPAPGQLAIVQTTTNETDTYINVLKGREAKYTYHVELAGQKIGALRKYQSVASGLSHHWQIDKLHISRLKPQITYDLVIFDEKYQVEIERRHFSTLNLDKKNVQFAVASCMSDSHRFQHIRLPIWQQMQELKPDLILLVGDNVYVDDSDYVDRTRLNAFDIWQRYIDSLRRTPLYQFKRLTPVLAIWDDHDYGVNNADKFFKNKIAARKVFEGFFTGQDLPGSYKRGAQQIYAQMTGFGQRFILLDNRTYREKTPNNTLYGFLGKAQHQWLLSELEKESLPTWLIAGGQFFAPAFQLKNGKQVNESFMIDYPQHHKKLIEDLKSVSSPIAFLSGDVHFSEIMRLEKEILGYETYELTSSPLHSYLFRANKEQDEFFANPRRVEAVKEYNFLFIDSFLDEQNLWKIHVNSYGPKQKEPFFTQQLSIKP